VFVTEDFTDRLYDGAGKVLSYKKLLSNPVFTNQSQERLLGAKYDLLYHLNDQNELMIGGQVLTTVKFANDVYFNSDTLRFDLNGDGIFEIPQSTFTNGRVKRDLGFGDEYKYGAYISDRISLTEQLTATAGIRYDYFTYSKKGKFQSPVQSVVRTSADDHAGESCLRGILSNAVLPDVRRQHRRGQEPFAGEFPFPSRGDRHRTHYG
jgi:outer membrane receptor protein involved in Fe transport